MNYKTPFYAISKSLYSVFKNNSSIGIEFFDSSVPIWEIETYHKNQTEFAYGVFTTQTADVTVPDDLPIWTSSIGIEIYSNYRGRKVITQKLEAILNYLSGDAGWLALSGALASAGYKLISIRVGELNVGLPVYGDSGIWQNGQTEITFIVNQIN